MKTLKLLLVLFLFSFSINAQWQKINVDTKASFRGLSVVNQNIIWASGTGGTFIKTVDGGKTWTVGNVLGADKLDFRDVEAFDANTAYLLSIGPGETSRIYKTTDGGKSWEMQFKNENPKAFFDALAFWDRDNGMAMSDPVDGYFYLLRTTNGGKNWYPVDKEKMFPAKEGEAGFAASGTCLVTQGKKNVWLVSGGKAARVFYSTSFGNAWIAKDAPIISGGAATGIFSIAMLDAKRGVIVGGDYQKPNEGNQNLAFTNDGGATWTPGGGLNGYRSAVAYIDRNTIIAVGTNGSDVSRDGGKTWKNIDKENYNSVQAKGRNAVWAVGPNGMVAKY